MARVLAGIAWVVATMALLMVSALVHLSHPVARRMIGRAVEQAVAASAPGVLRVGAIEEAGLDRLVLTNVRYWDLEEERQALDLERAEADLDTGSLWTDEIRILRVRVTGAQLTVEKSWKRPDAGWIAEFDAPPELRHQGKRVRIEDIQVDDLEVFAILDATPYRLHQLSGRGEVTIEDRAVIEVRDARASLELPGEGGEMGLADVSATLPHAPEEGGVARATGRVDVAGEVLDATLLYHDRDEPPPLEVSLSSEAFSKEALAALGVTEVGEARAPFAGQIRIEGTFRQAQVHPELTGAGGTQVTLDEPPAIEAEWRLDEESQKPPSTEGELTGPLLLYLFLTILLVAVLIGQVALMVWLLRRNEGRPAWRMVPVATAVATWMLGARAGAGAWFALLAAYLALLIGAG